MVRPVFEAPTTQGKYAVLDFADSPITLQRFGYLTVAEEILFNEVGLKLPDGASQARYEFEIAKALLSVRTTLHHEITDSLPFPHIHRIFEFFQSEREAGLAQVPASDEAQEPDEAPKTPLNSGMVSTSA